MGLKFAIALLGSITILPATAMAMEPYLPTSPRAFSKADADANGKVTAAELTPFAERRFARLDSDKNGAVTAAEIDTALSQAVERRRDRILAKLDADKNGAISGDELDRFVDALVASVDSDRDGGVSREELRDYRVAKRKKSGRGERHN
jgi:Ca2+-binding EF-hand superfamily protein